MPCPSTLPTIDAYWQYIDASDTFDTYDQGRTRATDMVHTVDSYLSCHFWKGGRWPAKLPPLQIKSYQQGTNSCQRKLTGKC